MEPVISGTSRALAEPVPVGNRRSFPREERSRWAPDALLVHLARLGSRLAFDCLWIRHSPTVHAVLVSLVPPGDADDLLQETALCAWRRIGTLHEARRFPGWACAIARHRGRDWVTARQNRRFLPLEDVVEPEQSPRAAACAEADEVLAVLRKLPACYAEPLLMKLMLGLKNREIAERTGMTAGSVRVNLHRGMRRLRRALGADGAR